MSFMGSTVDWTQRRKELTSLKICQQKLPKVKFREEKKKKKTTTEYSRTVGQSKRSNIQAIVILEGEEIENRRKSLSTND